MKRSHTVHFVGIGGIGMSALARILLQRGQTVTGSSDKPGRLIDELRAEGASIAIGHAAGNLGAAEVVVVTSAVDAHNPEVAAARARGLRLLRRGELLAELTAGKRTIAVAGTHGKTTTTAMTACVVEAGGFAPTVALGGVPAEGAANGRNGSGEWFVAESDESDGSFLALRPQIAVVTNVENDHIASDAEFPALLAAFERFLEGTAPGGAALICIDEPHAASLAALDLNAPVRTFGTSPAADVRASALRYRGFGSSSTIVIDGREAGTLDLRMPGEINVRNALGALSAGLELGMPFERAAAALAQFRGVRRRFEVLAATPRLVVVDDYAHHPTAVAATLRAARDAHAGPIVAVFQPHRYTRTRYLAAEFARALAEADRVILTEVYAASEAPLEGVGVEAIAAPLRAGGTAVDVVDVARTPGFVLAHAPHGSLALFLGAGSITEAAAATARELSAPALAP